MRNNKKGLFLIGKHLNACLRVSTKKICLGTQNFCHPNEPKKKRRRYRWNWFFSGTQKVWTSHSHMINLMIEECKWERNHSFVFLSQFISIADLIAKLQIAWTVAAARNWDKNDFEDNLWKFLRQTGFSEFGRCSRRRKQTPGRPRRPGGGGRKRRWLRKSCATAQGKTWRLTNHRASLESALVFGCAVFFVTTWMQFHSVSCYIR